MQSPSSVPAINPIYPTVKTAGFGKISHSFPSSSSAILNHGHNAAQVTR